MSAPLAPTYFVLRDASPPFIVCLLCRRVSYHPTDITARYCGWCHVFHDALAAARQLHADGATHDCGEWPTAVGTCAVCARSLVSPCQVYRPDHNGECLTCDEWMDAHTPEAIAAGEQLALTHGVDCTPHAQDDLARVVPLLLAAPACTCRNTRCGHPASQHTGPEGACLAPDCPCGPGGWR